MTIDDKGKDWLDHGVVVGVADQGFGGNENPPPSVPEAIPEAGHVEAVVDSGNGAPGRVLVPAQDTVPPKVLWNKEHRKFTDKIWGIVYVLSFIAFLSTGFVLVANAKTRFERDSDGLRIISSNFRADVESCCQEVAAQGDSLDYDLCDHLPGASGGRRLGVGGSKYDGDEGIFDAFQEAPGIVVGLLALALVAALVWIILIRFFSKPIVILTEVVKVAVFIYMGVVQENTGTRVICFIFAVGIVAYAFWARKEIMFAADILTHSTKAFKANPMMFVGCIIIKIFYVINAFLFVLFFSRGLDVVQVEKLTYCSEYFGESACSSHCVFVTPSYVTPIYTYIGLSYLWSVILFSKMRLSVIATVVGSWHFHPENNPGIIRAVINTVTTSTGTLAASSLIATIAERLNRMLQEPCWKSWLGPAACITLPLQLFLCVFGQCLETLIRMLTKFAVILHVFTGLPFIGSAKKVFKIMSRHFKSGFVTELTSQGVLNLGAYVFSIGIAFLAWAWLDDEFNCSTLPGGRDTTFVIAWILLGLFNLWYPVLGLYLIILINRLILQNLPDNENGDQGGYQHIWVNPLAAIFIGCISMMFFTYLAGIFLDTIDVLFLCFAIDKDNNVDMTNDEFQALIKTMPAYAEVVHAEAQPMDSNAGGTEEVKASPVSAV